MSITRRKSKTFTVVGNDIVNDQNLTLEALGLLVFMLSKPDNWTFNQEQMGRTFNKGRDAMRSIMKTLMSAGYVQRELQRNDKGHVKTVTIVTESPVPVIDRITEDRETDQPTVDNPSVGLPTPLVNTDFSKDLISKDLSAAKSVIDHLNEKSGSSFRHVDSNLKLVLARLKEGATIDECRQVIDRKCSDWLKDKKMQEYLRPATLFNATNFASYVGQLKIAPAAPAKPINPNFLGLK